MNQPNFNAVFFDLGMVLVYFDWNIAVPRFAAHSGGDRKRVRRFIADPVHVKFERKELSGDEFFRYGQDLMGFRGTREQFQSCWNEIFTEIPEGVAALRELASRCPVFVISNTNPWHAAYLEQRYDWMKLFSKRFYSCDIGARKPERQIFEYALREAGVAAADALLIDDRLENIEGAQELGMQTLHAVSPSVLKARTRELLGQDTAWRAPETVKATR